MDLMFPDEPMELPDRIAKVIKEEMGGGWEIVDEQRLPRLGAVLLSFDNGAERFDVSIYYRSWKNNG